MDTNTKYKAIEIADFLIEMVNGIPNDSIDNLKLNKLLYYIQGHSMAISGTGLIGDNFEAWGLGPVIPEVYRTFKCYGKDSIKKPSQKFDENRLTPEELELITDVYLNYGGYTGIELVHMTHHKDSPWDKVYEEKENNVIPEELIRQEFAGKELEVQGNDLVKNIPVSDSVPREWDSAEDSVYDFV